MDSKQSAGLKELLESIGLGRKRYGNKSGRGGWKEDDGDKGLFGRDKADRTNVGRNAWD